MLKRTLYFGNPAYLHLHEGQLVIRLPEVVKNDSLSTQFKKEATASIPVEDIGIVMIDHQQVTVTQALLDALLQNNTVTIICNATHHPEGLLLTLDGHTTQSERYRAQIDATEPLKKQMWAQTITQKIRNQAASLKMLNLDYQYLTALHKDVKSGDADNREATAAAYYWQTIFPHVAGFRRGREGAPPNNYLNYGYALLRATMARGIVGAGLLPTLGIHHRNRYNAFCLADDLMEPYRPMVDLLVHKTMLLNGLHEDIPKAVKVDLLQIPAMDVSIDGETSPLMNATFRTAVSAVKCYEGEQRKLLYPEL